MAVVNKMVRIIPNYGGIIYSTLDPQGGSHPLVNGDQSQWIECSPSTGVKAWQVTGTFGVGGSIQLEASNDAVNPIIQGAALTAPGLVNATVAARFLRFNVTAGDGTTSLTVTLIMAAIRGS